MLPMWAVLWASGGGAVRCGAGERRVTAGCLSVCRQVGATACCQPPPTRSRSSSAARTVRPSSPASPPSRTTWRASTSRCPSSAGSAGNSAPIRVSFECIGVGYIGTERWLLGKRERFAARVVRGSHWSILHDRGRRDTVRAMREALCGWSSESGGRLRKM